MARTAKWKVGTFKNFKLKLTNEKAERYQQILKIKNKTAQQDFEDHVDKTLDN